VAIMVGSWPGTRWTGQRCTGQHGIHSDPPEQASPAGMQGCMLGQRSTGQNGIQSDGPHEQASLAGMQQGCMLVVVHAGGVESCDAPETTLTMDEGHSIPVLLTSMPG
jgi:hypothetical protein